MYKLSVRSIIIGAVLAGAVCTGCGKDAGYYEKAQQYLEKNAYAHAIEYYNKAVMEDEELQQSYRGAGIAYMKLGDYEKAEEMFLRALKASDGTLGDMELDLSYYLGETRMHLGEYKEAVEIYTNLLEVYDEETEAYFYRGCAYLQLGEAGKAGKDFKVAEKEQDIVVLYGIFEAYEQQGSDEGYAYLDKITASKGDSAEELYVRGKAYYKLGDMDKAVELLKSSEKKGNTSATLFLGNAYEQMGDYATALQYYGTCMETADEAQLQELLFREIVIYEKSGNYSEARSKAEAYVEEYPDDEEGKKEYQFLLTR